MKILLLGANGQVGWELRRALAPLGEVIACDRQRADMSRPETLAPLLRQCRPDVIVNAAAYTAVDKAETDEAGAALVNSTSVGELAALAKELDALLVHYSTDYVFDGTAIGFQREDGPTAPLNVYGRTKLQGERLIKASGCRHLLLRTSWVYACRGRNFAKTMLRLACERDELKVVVDQVGAPTSAELIADVSALMIQRLRHDPDFAVQAYGTYHLVAGGKTSWHEFTRFIIRTARGLGMSFRAEDARILPIRAAEFPAAAARPASSLLDTRKLQSTFDLQLPHWQEHAERMLHETVPVEVAARVANEHLDQALQRSESPSPIALATRRP